MIKGIWLNYCKSIKLSEDQILGLAYFNTAIPTVLSYIDQDVEILAPLSKVVKDIGKSETIKFNCIHPFREFMLTQKL